VLEARRVVEIADQNREAAPLVLRRERAQGLRQIGGAARQEARQEAKDREDPALAACRRQSLEGALGDRQDRHAIEIGKPDVSERRH